MPSQETLICDIQEGDYLLLLHTSNWVWTQVIAVLEKGFYNGIIATKKSSLEFGSIVRFHHKHIYDVKESVSQTDASIHESHQA